MENRPIVTEDSLPLMTISVGLGSSLHPPLRPLALSNIFTQFVQNSKLVGVGEVRSLVFLKILLERFQHF